MRSKSSMRYISVWLVVIILVMSLKTFLFASEITVEIWGISVYEKETKAAWEKMVDEFAKETGIRIKFLSIPYADYETKFRVAAAAGQLPDIYQIDNIFIPAYTERGLVADLSKVIPKEVAKDYWESIRPIMFYPYPPGTILRAIPHHMSVTVFLYNTRILREAGFKNPPKYWDDMLEIALKCTKDFNGDGKIDQYGLRIPHARNEGGVYQVLPFLQMKGGGMLSDDGKNVIVNNKGSIEVFQFLQDLIYKYKVMPLEGTIQAGPEGPWVAEKVAMQFDWGSAVGNYEKNYPKFTTWDVGYTPYPKDGKRVVGLGGWYFAMVPNPKNYDAAAKVMNFLSSEKYIRDFQGVFNPPITRKSIALKTQLSKRQRIMLEGFKWGKIRPRHPEYAKLSEYFQEAIDRILFGKQSVSDVLNEVATKMKSVISAK